TGLPSFPTRRSSDLQHARLCQERLKKRGRVFEGYAFVRQDFRDSAEKRVSVAQIEGEQQLRQAPIGADAGKNLLVLHLSRHDGRSEEHTSELQSPYD